MEKLLLLLLLLFCLDMGIILLYTEKYDFVADDESFFFFFTVQVGFVFTSVNIMLRQRINPFLWQNILFDARGISNAK